MKSQEKILEEQKKIEEYLQSDYYKKIKDIRDIAYLEGKLHTITWILENW